MSACGRGSPAGSLSRWALLVKSCGSKSSRPASGRRAAVSSEPSTCRCRCWPISPRSVTHNGRDLEGALNRLLAHSKLTGQPVTLEMAEREVRDLIRPQEPKRVKIEDIQRIVARQYNVSRADLLSSRRTANVVRPRQVAMYLAKTLTLAVAAGNRPPLRRPRPPGGAACRPQDRGPGRQRRHAGRRDRSPEAPAAGVGAPAGHPARGWAVSRWTALGVGVAVVYPPGQPCACPALASLAGMPSTRARGFLAPKGGFAMKVTVERAELLKSLSHVHRVVERRNTIPILANVLVRAEKRRLSLKATDLDLEVIESIAAEVGAGRLDHRAGAHVLRHRAQAAGRLAGRARGLRRPRRAGDPRRTLALHLADAARKRFPRPRRRRR